MATVFRDPVVTNNRPKIDATHLRQFVSAGLALLTAVALPVGQARHTNVGFDIPNPKFKVDSPIARDRQRINDLPRQLAQTLPFNQAQWPLARLRLPATPETPYLNIATIRTVIVTTAPFYQTDWPLPKKGALDLPDASWEAPLTLIAPKPFLQSDWFVPQKFRPDPPDATWSESLALTFTGQPFVQSNWPLPQKFRPDPPDVTYSESLALSFGGQPFALREWPLPRRARNAPDSQVQNIAALRTVIVSTKPFVQLGWDLPRRIDSPLARDRQRQNDLARQTAVTLPARPYDWPIPKGRRAKIPDTLYGTPQQLKVIASTTITLAATEPQDTAAFNFSFWRVEPIPPDGWTPEAIGGGSREALQFVTNSGSAIRFVNNGGGEIVFSGNATSAWTPVPFTAAGWIREFVPGAGPILQFISDDGTLIMFVNDLGEEIFFTADQVDIWNAEAVASDTWTKRNG
jgi:hypothetical protein